ncbi:MAG: type I DNA topoisomerase [Candidatus Fermentibacteraceae bacterium]
MGSRRKLLIIESPAKAKALKSYLGRDWTVTASMGHVRDLPLHRIGVTGEEFQPAYTILPEKRKTLAKLKKDAEGFETIFLAADPDREGEAICWHLAELLADGTRVFKRLRFNAVTREAVTKAAAHPGCIDMNLVNAQQARRVMDRLVGYRISPYLWRTLGKGLSAGRVQTVALRLITDREAEITAFKSAEYWQVTADFKQGDSRFTALLHRIGGRRADGARFAPGTREQVEEITPAIRTRDWAVISVDRAKKVRKPSPPFITSTLQAAGAGISMSPGTVMRHAQQLYEGVELDGESVGLITYMRTDSVRISPEAVDQCREAVVGIFGDGLLSPSPRRFRASGGSQDAHEAIRPTDMNRTPDSLAGRLDPGLLKLYTMIWNRFAATQMADAEIEETSVTFQGGEFVFLATGGRLTKPGFSAADPTQIRIPRPIAAAEKGRADLLDLRAEQKFTEPPARFGEASLVTEMKKQGIGRPSTYVAILSTLKKRGYIDLREKKLHPTDLGVRTVELLVGLFPHLFEVGFTAGMEQTLDMVAAGEMDYVSAVKGLAVPLETSLTHAMTKLPEVRRELTSQTDQTCPQCGKPLLDKWGRFGRFLACSGYPNCRYTRPVEEEGTQGNTAAPVRECPDCGSPMTVRSGKFGAYLSCSSASCDRKSPMPTGVHCPLDGCSGELVTRRSQKGRTFYSCSRYPDCDFAMWNPPMDTPCPRCGFPIQEKKAKGVYCPRCKKKTD